jgi:hypothetical protein
MQFPLASQDPEIADHLRAIRDRARQVRGHPAPVMKQQPRAGQRPRQPGRQPGLVR